MIELADPKSAERVADWVELQVSLSDTSVQTGLVSAAVRAASGDEAGDAFLASVWLQLERRAALYQPCPFTLEENVAHPQAISELKARVYRLCLILSLYGAVDKTRTPQDLFERITSEALRANFNAESMVFGYRGRGIGETTEELATTVGEIFASEPATRFKDRGLDVVTWKHFPDRRSGKLIVLTQCAAGHDWKDKAPVPVRGWEQYIHWAIRPTIGYAISCVVPKKYWHDKSTDKGMLLDRVRLMNCTQDTFADTTLSNDIDQWLGEWINENT